MPKKSISWLNQYKIIRQYIYDAVSAETCGGLVLDVGCGESPYRELFENYVGIDVKSGDIKGGMPWLPIKNESVEMVICTEVLEHLKDPGLAFDEFYRVIERGGKLLLTTPQSWGVHEAPNDYYRYTKFGLMYLAEKSGFDVVWVRQLGGFWAMIGQRLSSYAFYMIPFGQVLCGVIQPIFWALDGLNYIEGDTMGNVLLARKR